MENRHKEYLTIGAVQPALRPSHLSPIEAAKHVVHLMREVASKHEKCKHKKIDLFILPELCPLGYSEDTFEKFLPKNKSLIETLENLDKLLQSSAKELDCYICYGTIGTIPRTNENNHKYTIRQNVINNTGNLVCSYDKIHLCNYGDCAETRFFTPGNEPCAFHCHGFKIGVIICADMRNPSLTRVLAGKPFNCDVILQPAAFSRDISFRTWKSFRETRAVENSVYFVAVNYAGDYYGNTSIVGPWIDEGHEPEVMGCEEGILVKEIRREVLHQVRQNFPYHRQLMSEEWQKILR